MKRIICIAVAAAALLSLFSCKGSEVTTDGIETDEQTYVMTNISDVPSPVSINGEAVPYEIFRYYFAAVRYRYDSDDETYWLNHEYTEKIREEVMRYIRRNYALLEYAAQYGVALTDYEKKQIEQQLMQERLSSYPSDYEYYKTLDDYYMTEHVNQYIEELSSLKDKLLEYLTSEESGPRITDEEELIRRYLDKSVIRADHILILNDPGDDVNENETLIKEIYAKLKAGEDFETLKEKYSEDTETNMSDTGYYLARDDISQIFSDTAFSLEEGQMSEVIEAPYGYHIIIRLPKDEGYINDNLTSVFLPFYQSHMLETGITKLVDRQTVVYDDSFYTYTPQNLK